jgi:hypothetical protein
MEKLCKNCKHFAQVSFGVSKHIWGDCMKSAGSIEGDDREDRGTFMWGDKTCSDYKPKEELK